jgi:hypothetical protein
MIRALIGLVFSIVVFAQSYAPAPTTVCGSVALAAQSTSITATNLLCNGVMAPAGVYRISATLNTTSGQSGSGNVSTIATWTAGGVGFTTGAGNGLTSNLLLGAVTVSPSALAATSGGSKVIRHDGTTHITWSTTYASTGQYDIYIILEKLL